MTALVTIAGYAVPEPAEYRSSTATLVDSARNTNGVMVGSVIRENVAKVECKWKYLTTTQWACITQCFDSTRGGSFINDVTFFNQDTGVYDTRSMYVGDRAAGLYLRSPVNNEVLGWKDCSLSLIEV